MFKLDLEKLEKPEIKKKQRNSKKICFIDYTKTFDCVDHNQL